MNVERQTLSCANMACVPSEAEKSLLKRLGDCFFSILLTLVLSPLLLLIALLIKVSSSGPVIYADNRVGLHGKCFRMYKFRTMFDGADLLKAQLMQQNEMQGPAFKMKQDPRITRVGAILRKYSLDELPQLINIFKGEMSLVGPRPPLVQEYEQYQLWHKRRLSVRPGATGLWQVSGRNEISNFDDWVKLDLQYIDQWSVWLDLVILFKTVAVVLKGTGY